MKKAFLIASIILFMAAEAFAFSGAGSIWYQAKGTFTPVNVPGDSAGFGRARDVCIARGGGVIQLGPGCENVVTTFPTNANLTVIKAFITGWSIFPNITSAVVGAGFIEAIPKAGAIQVFEGSQTGLALAVTTAGPGGNIKIGPGRYNISSTVIFGQPGQTIEGTSDSTFFSITASDTAFHVAADKVTVKDIVIDGNFGYITGASGVSVDADDVTLEGLRFRHVYDNGITGYTGADRLKVENCKFLGIGTTLTTQGTAVRVSGTAPHVTECQIDSTSGFAILVTQATKYRIDHNRLSVTGWGSTQTGFDPNYKEGGIVIDTLSYGGIVESNIVDNTGNSNIENIHANGDSTLIQGNYLFGGASGIHWGYDYTAGRGSSILNNYILHPRFFGFFAENLSQSMNGFSFIGNTLMMEGSIGDGIDIESSSSLAAFTASQIVISTNTIFKPGRSGIRFKGRDNGSFDQIDVSNNTVYQPILHGIEIDQTSGVSNTYQFSITQNKVYDALGSGLFLDNVPLASAAFVSGNIFENCATNENIGTNWNLQGTFKSNLRATFTDIEDSLRVRKNANFDQGVQATGTSWIAGKFSVRDSIRANQRIIGDVGTQITGDSWYAGKLHIRDSLRTTQRIMSSAGYQVTGDSWISGKLQVSDSLRTLRMLVSDSLRARKLLVQDSLRIMGPLDVSNGNVIITGSNGYQMRDAGGTARSAISSGGGVNTNVNALDGSGRVQLRSLANLVGVSTDNNGDTYIGSSLNATDSVRATGPLVGATKATVFDSLRVIGKLDVGTKTGIPQFHSFGNGGTTDADTVTLYLNGTSSTSGVPTRSPKVFWARNGTPTGTLASYAGGLELRVATGNRLGFGTLGGTSSLPANIFADGHANFTGLDADSLTTAQNVHPSGHIVLNDTKALVGTLGAFISLSNTGSIKMKSTGGTEASVLHSAGGTDILRISPIASGQSINFLNFAGTDFNLAVTDGGITRLRSFVQASLPAVLDGGMVYCSDCTKANPCAGGGTGSIAFGVNGAWECNH